jgi:hypothetical protein
MTILRRIHDNWLLLGFALLVVGPGVAIRLGLLPFAMRFEVMILVSAIIIGLCVYAGYSAAELGLRAPHLARHWLGCGLVTLVVAAAIHAQAGFVPADRPQPDWMTFAPFYILVSSPCQELVCRAVPKIITDRLAISNAAYVFFSAGVFSLMHLAYDDPLLLAGAFVVGLAWAGAYLATRNIWPVAASHAVVGSFAFWLGLA